MLNSRSSGAPGSDWQSIQWPGTTLIVSLAPIRLEACRYTKADWMIFRISKELNIQGFFDSIYELYRPRNDKLRHVVNPNHAHTSQHSQQFPLPTIRRVTRKLPPKPAKPQNCHHFIRKNQPLWIHNHAIQCHLTHVTRKSKLIPQNSQKFAWLPKSGLQHYLIQNCWVSPWILFGASWNMKPITSVEVGSSGEDRRRGRRLNL